MPFQATVPYADVDYANAYFASRLGTDAWDAATLGKQVAALSQATRAIDILNFVGEKHDKTWSAAPSPPPTPILTPAGGGALPAGAYKVAFAFVYGVATGNPSPPFASGAESPLGPSSTASVSPSGTISVAGTITVPPSAVGYAIYATTNGGSKYYLQQFVPTSGTATVAFTIVAGPTYPAFASCGSGQVLPFANQPNQFPRGDDTTVPDAVSQACCELALSLLDDVDPNMEIENLRNVQMGTGDARVVRDTSYVAEHIRAGIPNIQAWLLLVPFLRDTQHPQRVIERAG